MKSTLLCVALLIASWGASATDAKANYDNDKKEKDKNMNTKGTPDATIALTWSPIILFLLVGGITLIKLRNNGTSMTDIIAEKNPSYNFPLAQQEVGGATADGSNAIYAEGKGNNANQTAQTSTSRLLAFLSGIITVGLSCCFTSFFIYQYSIGNKDVDLGKLYTVLIGLGIGIVPYSINKITSPVNKQ